jgi:hypothetical protein
VRITISLYNSSCKENKALTLNQKSAQVIVNCSFNYIKVPFYTLKKSFSRSFFLTFPARLRLNHTINITKFFHDEVLWSLLFLYINIYRKCSSRVFQSHRTWPALLLISSSMDEDTVDLGLGNCAETSMDDISG